MQVLLSQTGQDGLFSCVAICVTLSNICRALNVTNALFKAAATREGKMVSEGEWGRKDSSERTIFCLMSLKEDILLPVFK